MAIYKAINTLKTTAPLSQTKSEAFINSLDFTIQKQVIAAIYIGRDHIHSDNWNKDNMLSTNYIDHIPKEDYAKIVHEKNSALINYLDSIERCANNEGFDLNLL